MHQQQPSIRLDEPALLERYQAAMASAGSDLAAQRRALVPLIREAAAATRGEAEARLIADGHGTGARGP